jgi:glycosyltransferase involved in cell wall biosynthesis
MPARTEVSILVPVYNEEEGLPAFLERLAPVVDRRPRRAEVVFVDDASGDRSAAVIEGFCAKVPGCRLVRHGANRGRGQAILTGVEAARGRILVTIDSDLENPPEAIPDLVAGMRPGLSCLTGWRQGRGRRDPRGLASWVYNTAMARLTGRPLHDFNCGLKAFRTEVFELGAVRAWLERDGDYFRFIVYLLSRLGYRTEECPIAYEPRARGRSRYGWKRYGKSALDLLALLAADLRSGLLWRRRLG